MDARQLFCIVLVLMLSSGNGYPADRILQQGATDAISGSFLRPLKSDFITPAQLGLTHEESKIPNETGSQLRLWKFNVTGAKQTVLFCMGNQGNISTHLAYTKLLCDGGFNVVMFDYQGFGGSQGSASALSLYADTCKVAAHLIDDMKLDPQNLGSFGVSLGSPLAIAVAGKYRFGAVAIEDVLLPGKKLDEIAQHLPKDFASQLAIGTIRNVILPQVDPLVTVKKLNCPLLIMHGERDQLLPPSGSIELAHAAPNMARVWLMADAGHAPETLEIYDGEYGHQLTRFFREAFAGELHEPKLAMSAVADQDQWKATIDIQCTHAGNYQIAVASQDGRCHFLRTHVTGQCQLTQQIAFEPKHVSAILIQNAKPIEQSSWTAIKTPRSSSLENFRRFEADFASQCPLKSHMAISFGALRKTVYRTESDLQWLKERLPPASDVHPDVRPRYARLVASVFGQLPADRQTSLVTFVELLVPFLPEDPYQYFQLENAGFQLQLRDEQLAGALILLAKHHHAQRQLEQAQRLLTTAAKITFQFWPHPERIAKLKAEDRFFESLVPEIFPP